jgi:hypothetical protein
MAPEECVESPDGVVTSRESDVYMAGGLLYELLTGGTPPYHWLVDYPELLTARRRTAGKVLVAPGVFVDGLLGKHVLEVAAADGKVVPWCVRGPGTLAGVGHGRFGEAMHWLTRCLAAEPGARPSTSDLMNTCHALAEQEASAAKEAGCWDPLVHAPVLMP